MKFYKISAEDFQYMEMSCRKIQRTTNGCRKSLKAYGESMIENAMLKRNEIEEVPKSFCVLVIKNANAGSGNFGDYYKTVDVFSATKETMQETNCFMRFRDRRVKKENVLALVF